MANSSLIGVPTDFRDLSQVKLFLVKLIEKLDVILGFRSDEKYVSRKDLVGTSVTVAEALTELKELLELQITGLTSELSSTEESLNALDSRLSTGIVIVPVSYSAPSVNGTYNQAQIQSIADSLEVVSVAVDSIIGALTSAGIIA
jgi:hypothetical protein